LWKVPNARVVFRPKWKRPKGVNTAMAQQKKGLFSRSSKGLSRGEEYWRQFKESLNSE